MACRQRPLRDGGQAILDLYLPGNFIELDSLFFAPSLDTVLALTNVNYWALDHGALNRLMQEPRFALQLMRHMAEEKQRLDTNAILLGKLKARERRERYLSTDEFARLGDALATSAEEGSESCFALAAIRLLIFTGARLGEVLTFRWDYVDLEQRVLKLPDSKTGRKLIWLNPPAVEILTAMPRIKGNPFVIVGDREGAHLVNIQKVWRRICRRANIPDVRIHDLRHSYASVAVAAGVGLFLTGKILGHLRASTTERYAHLADDPVRQANDAIGRRIHEVLSSPVADSEKITHKRVFI